MSEQVEQNDTQAIKELWLEWLVTHQTATGDGPRFMLLAPHIPEWFRLCELGLGVLEGPTVFWTLQNLSRINRKNRKLLSRTERGADRERLDAETRRRKWRAMLKIAEAA